MNLACSLFALSLIEFLELRRDRLSYLVLYARTETAGGFKW